MKKQNNARQLKNPIIEATPVVEFNNSLDSFTQSLSGGGFGMQLSQTDTVSKNNRRYFISNNRSELSYMFITHGLIQTFINQPVDDAFRDGFELDCPQLSPEQIEEFHHNFMQRGFLEKTKQLFKWVRLYGGGGLVINAPGNPGSELKIESIKENSLLDIYPADLWELNRTSINQYSQDKPYVRPIFDSQDPYFYYGVRLHRSRVIAVNNKEAPAFLRPSLRGWGMSECERILRSFNQYLKYQDLIFELLDEAKIDIFKIQNFNNSLLTPGGTNKVASRIEMANRVKNFQNALVFDTLDEYEQKQMNFAGLSELFEQLRTQIACDFTFPVDKLFGDVPAGFSNSNESGMENYNAMVTGNVRNPAKPILSTLAKICIQKDFGFVPDYCGIRFKPLRILNAEQEMNVKTQQFNMALNMYDRGLFTNEDVKNQLNAANVMPTAIKNDTKKGFPTPPPSPQSIAPIKKVI